jgi:transcription antitermination factor NusG
MGERVSHLQSSFSALPLTALSLKWYAVCTYPRYEKTVADQLEAKGVETFLPIAVTERQRKDRRVKLQMPVFPGYVFTRIDMGDRNKVLGAFGVVRILSSNGKPMPIDNTEIEGIRICAERVSRFETQPLLGIGDRVRVRSGMLEGLEGFITSCKKDRRLIVPITLTHQAISFEVDIELLERLRPEDV